MRYLMLMLVLLTGARFECPGGAEPSRVPFSLPYVQRGLCPVPCGVYRNWTAREDLIAHRAPSMASPFNLRIPSGRTFAAVTGEMITLEPGVAVVRRAGGSFAKGDTLWVLSPAVKGGFTVWHKGSLRTVDLVVPKKGAPAPVPEGEEEGKGLRAVRSTPQNAEWWVRIRYGGRTGWIRVNPTDPPIDGIGHCG